jgi:2-polyprenyl-6-methoxyphenol hydroxylase-like FAD-dependent oxidoreductase
MFLADLSKSEQDTFLSLARNMVAADEKVTPEEEELLRDLHIEIGQAVVIEPMQQDIEQLCEAVSDRGAQAKMLLELSSIAHVDGDYEERERHMIRSIAKKWKIDQLSVLRAEDWGQRRVALIVDAAHIVHEITI